MTWCIAYTSVVQYKIWLPRQQPANIDYNPSARSSRELSDPPVVFLPRLERMPWARAQPVTPDDHSELVPLLPIPNRTVKRLCADDSGRTSVKVGHRQAFIARTRSSTLRGFVFGHANALAPRGRTGYAAPARPAWGTGPLQPRLAQDMNTRRPRGSRRGAFYASLRASRAPAIAAACWSPAGDHTPRPRGSGGNAGRTGLSGMRTLKAPRICREASAPATSSGLLPLSGQGLLLTTARHARAGCQKRADPFHSLPQGGRKSSLSRRIGTRSAACCRASCRYSSCQCQPK